MAKTQASPLLGQRVITVALLGGGRSVKFPDYDGQCERNDFHIRPQVKLQNKTQASASGKLLQLSMPRELWRKKILLLKEKKRLLESSATFYDTAMCKTNKDKGVEGEMPVAKRLKSGETGMFFKSERDTGSLSSAANHIEKEDVLFDMDALSQFPVECICSPPPLNCVSDSLNVGTVASTARQRKQVMSSEDGIRNMQTSTGTVLQDIDASTICKPGEANIYGGGVQSVERTLQNKDERKESDMMENPVSCANLQNNALPLLPESNTGFHTAGGQKIEISDKALSSALALFEEFDLPTTSFTSQDNGPTADEVVGAGSVREGRNLTKGTKLEMALSQENHGGVSKRAIGSHQLGRYSPEKEDKVEKVWIDMFDYSNVKSYITDSVAPEFAGFHTASGKHVSISSEALTKAKATMKEIDNSLGLHEWPNRQLQESSDCSKICDVGQLASLSCKPIPDSDIVRVPSCVEGEIAEQRADHKHFAKRENVSGLEKQQSPVVSGFCGFSTASGKQVHVSESAMKQPRKTLKEIDAELNVSSSSRPAFESAVTTPRIPSVSFQTASGKSVSVSQADLNKAKDTWNKIDQELALAGADRIQRKDLESRNGFQTVPVRAVDNLQSSLCTLNAARSITKKADEGFENDGHCRRMSNVSKFSGFETAGGKKVTLSEEALRRGRDIMKRIATEPSHDCLDKEDERSPSFTACNHLTSRKNNRASKGAEERRDLERNEADKGKDYHLGFQTRRGKKREETDKGSNSSAFLGFQTAAGKRVEMSEEALQRGAQIMQQIDNSLEQGINESKHNTDHVTGVPRVNLSNKSSVPHLRSTSGFSGFQTASGQSVNLSKESLEKGAAIMQQIDKSLEQNWDTSGSHSRSTSGFTGFQTASGQNVKLSKESLEKEAAIVQQIDKSLEQNMDASVSHSGSTLGFTGFQTASGQNVNLSKESLEKGAAIMQQIDRSLEQNRDASVSHSRSTSGFTGFQTASGQNVKLSKESLEKEAAIMQQIDRSLEQNTQGCQCISFTQHIRFYWFSNC
ncbi:hypothetical protein ACROYT_G020542 [Oculina patagonica]